MNIEKFLRSRPYIYHLTHHDNVASILESRRLESTVNLAEKINLAGREAFLQGRRAINQVIANEQHSFVIRDQAQINSALENCLVNCTREQFIYLLNTKVFFWPTIKDVSGHFSTYMEEGPRILRFRTADVLALNAPPMFCHVNSGSSRPHPAYGGRPAPRGMNTFAAAENFDYIPSKVREVTFDRICLLPENVAIADRPDHEFVAP